MAERDSDAQKRLEQQREARAKQIEADALRAEMAKHEKATRVAEGLMKKNELLAKRAAEQAKKKK